ncbi:MAG TPA: hypothetical protein VMW66_05380 [Elusimicrobiales bacterium]|nr:hypothetical protein [Elusimicrobiales bacterium]
MKKQIKISYGRVPLLIIPMVFLAGLSFVVLLKIMFKSGVKFTTDNEYSAYQDVSDFDDTVKNSANEKFSDKKSMNTGETEDDKTGTSKTTAQIIPIKGLQEILPKKKTRKELMEDMQKQQEISRRPVVILEEDEMRQLKKKYPANAQETPSASLLKEPSENLEDNISHRSIIDILVKHKVFRTAKNYDLFKKTRYGNYPKADFSKEMVVILISDDRYPNKVFEIIEAVETKNKVIIKYRVNILKITESDQRDYYTSIIIKKTKLPIELEQTV